MNCLVNNKGEYLGVLQKEKEPLEGQHLVPLEGYYEVFNAQLYSQAVWSFKLKKWVGVGEPNVPPIPQPTETEVLKSDIDFQNMLVQEQQAEIDYLKMVIGG